MARYLVVDDDPSTVGAMAQLLELDGHEVTPFTSGADAVAALARGPYDAVVTDLEMRGTDGRAVVAAACEHHPDACIVVVTGRAHRKLELTRAGACAVLDKPVHYDAITQIVADCRSSRGTDCHLKRGRS